MKYKIQHLGLIIILPLVTFLGSEERILYLQQKLGFSTGLLVGKAEINAPESWLLTFSKKTKGSPSFLYGFVPAWIPIENNSIFTFKKEENNRYTEISIMSISNAKVIFANKVLAKLQVEDNSKTTDIICLFGFNALQTEIVFRDGKNRLSISIPSLMLSLLVTEAADINELNVRADKTLSLSSECMSQSMGQSMGSD